jgi:hypothetical protein
MVQPKPGDMKAGFTGLIIAGIALLIILTTIVHFTNRKYEGERPAAAESR